MKRLFTILMLAMAMMFAVSCEKGGEDTPTTPPADEGEVTPPTPTPEGAIDFADSEVKRICVENWDTNKDSELTKDEAAAVADLGEAFFDAKIQEFTELQYFTGLTTISKNAFIYCTVKKIALPDGIVRIKSEAFKYCDQLEEITIPAGVTSIEEEALLGCESMQIITVLATTPPSLGNDALFCLEPKFKILVPRESYMAYTQAAGWKQYADVIFDLDGNPMLIDFADSEVKRLCVKNWDTDGNGELSYKEAAAVTDLGDVFGYNDTIKSFDELQYFTALKTIGDYEFGYCKSLTSITLPNSVTSVGDKAFYDCESLTSIILPNSVTNIGDYAFGSCSSMTSITIFSDSLESIDRNICMECHNLSAIYGKFASDDNRCLIVDGVLNSVAPAGLTEFVIPSGVTEIGWFTFYDLDNFTSITIPESVSKINDYAFRDCSSLTSVYCKPTTPPEGNTGMFDDNAWYRKIYVPTASVEAYKSAVYWSDYADAIVGYDF